MASAGRDEDENEDEDTDADAHVVNSGRRAVKRAKSGRRNMDEDEDEARRDTARRAKNRYVKLNFLRYVKFKFA